MLEWLLEGLAGTGERDLRRPGPVLLVEAAEEDGPDVEGALAFFLPPNRENRDTIPVQVANAAGLDGVCRDEEKKL